MKTALGLRRFRKSTLLLCGLRAEHHGLRAPWGRSVGYPVKLILRRHGGASLVRAVARLQSVLQAAATEVWLCQMPIRRFHYGAPGWSAGCYRGRERGRPNAL